MKLKLKENQKGFTIIEVLIVLAIAGLIMVIVFLAVPSLQRNSRNTQREADVSKIAAAISQCMANRNGQTGSCNTQALLEGAGGLDTSKFQQLQATTSGSTTTAAVTYGSTAPTADDAGLSKATFTFGQKCDATGSGITGGQSRQAVIQYRAEAATVSASAIRCLDV